MTSRRKQRREKQRMLEVLENELLNEQERMNDIEENNARSSWLPELDEDDWYEEYWDDELNYDDYYDDYFDDDYLHEATRYPTPGTHLMDSDGKFWLVLEDLNCASLLNGEILPPHKLKDPSQA